MKKIIIAVALMIGMTSCTKEETPTPQPQPATQVDTLDWTLDVKSTQLNVSYKGLHPTTVYMLLGDDDSPIGRMFHYEINGDAFDVLYVWEGDAVVKFIGAMGGHSFTNITPPISATVTLINMCNGPQGTSVSFTLYNHNHQVKGLRGFGS